MTKEEIIDKAELITGEYVKYLRFEDFNSLFEKKITYQIFFDKYNQEGFELTKEIMESLNFFLNFNKEKIEWIKRLSFEHFELCAANTDYGTPNELLEKYNNNYKKANMEFFRIYNMEDSFANAKLDFVDILEQENDNIIDIYLVLYFSVPWETEHGMKFHFKNKNFSEVE